MAGKIDELEVILEADKSELLNPMIKDACNYLRTLIQMKNEEAGAEVGLCVKQHFDSVPAVGKIPGGVIVWDWAERDEQAV